MEDLLYKALSAGPTSMGAFDYLKDPLQRNDMRALLRLYDLIPVMAQAILDEMVDRIQDGQKNCFKGAMKVDYNKISRLLSNDSRNAFKRYKEDEEKHGCSTAVGEAHLQMKILDELSRKVLPYISKDTREVWANHPQFYDLMSKGRIVKFVKKYVSLLSLLEEIMNTEDLITYKKSVIDKCIPMGQLEVGQEFLFPIKEHQMDDAGQIFTYLGLAEEDIPGDPSNKNVVCHYRKLSDNIHIVYIEQNALRAVLPVSNN